MGGRLEKTVSRIVTFYKNESKGIIDEDMLDKILVDVYLLIKEAIKLLKSIMYDIPELRKVGNKRNLLGQLIQAEVTLEGGIHTKKIKNKTVALDIAIHLIHCSWQIDKYFPKFKKFRKK